ncbi:MAG TPA: penicillin acylase family protein [Thermoleophilaceae bacterium]|nr:penicillin acylase family protein [Thermoleophilaceae bacterium]
MGATGRVGRSVRTLLLAGALGLAALATPAEAAYEAKVIRTAHGIPHITGATLGDAAFGYGYSLAKDNACTLAVDYVRVRGEASKFFGAGNSYVFEGNGSSANNLNSDFFFRRIIETGVVEDLLDRPPPHGPLPEVKQAISGYVEGYNKAIAQGITDPTCAGKPWVRPITEMDAWRRFYQLILIASQGVAIDGIASATPPHPNAVPQVQPPPSEVVKGLRRGGITNQGAIGSNAVAVGRDGTDNERGMLVGNPHFPWQSSQRFYQAHITVPGEIDAQGASLYGVPLILIGHTEGLAWSHTVSTAFRFTPFEVTLVPGRPTAYLYDGKPREMRADEVTVDLGNGQTAKRTLYSTHHGPVFSSLVGLPFPWTPAKAFVMGDANAPNFRAINHFYETNRAQSVEELDSILKANIGIPWVNTIAADADGDAYYADISVVPNVTTEKVRLCGGPLGIATHQALRLPVLDGSRSMCEWGTDPDAVAPGIFGPSNLPSIKRDDYVTNSNDSYWLSNPEQPLEGYERIIGDERTARSLRTRSGLVMMREQLANGDRMTLQELQDLTFSNRVHAGELWQEEAARMCRQSPLAPSGSGPVDVSAACAAIEGWDTRDDLDSNGAVLFRRFAGRALGAGGGPYTVPFDVNDPVNTPRGLNTAHPQVRQALGDAVNDLRGANIPLDAPLRGVQSEDRGGTPIPIHGGPHSTGVFNVISAAWRPQSGGYPDVAHGSSFVIAAQFKDGACPVEARTIMTYSQSVDPTSPWYADQTEMYSRKEWNTPPFCRSDVEAAAISTDVLTGG